MKRLFDFILALVATSILLVPIAVTTMLVRLTSKGPALYWSGRVGNNNQIFRMQKFRSMKVDMSFVGPHLHYLIKMI